VAASLVSFTLSCTVLTLLSATLICAPGVLVQEVGEAAVFVFFCYYQHDCLRGLPIFLSETCARVLRVLRWESSRMRV